MSTAEMNTAGTDGDQRLKVLPFSEEDSPPVVNDISAPLNFSELTPSQFGISVQSFTPISSNRKDKSRVAQIKGRRRSSVGVRGSPETNSLIRFMAQQRMKTPPSHRTPELVKSSPFLPRVASTLRQKMASFQSLMDVEETEVCDPMPRQDNSTGGCIKTRDYLSDGKNLDGGKENLPPMMTPTPSKRRRVGPLEGCKVEIREARTPILHLNFKEQEEDADPVTQTVTKGPLPSSETVEEAQAVLISPPVHVDFEPRVFPELQACSPTNNQQDSVFELQSPRRLPPDDLIAASPALPASPFHIPSLPSLLEMKPTGEDGSSVTSTVKKKKKQVRFGGPLSPEFFDKNLPPSTPLQKGGTPARALTPGGSLKLRSLLKTPQKGEPQTPQAQPDLSSPTVFGASPTLVMPCSYRMQSVGEDSEEKDGKIVFPSMEEIDSAGATDTGLMWDTQPLNLDTAFHEESLSQILTESVTKPSTNTQMDTLDEPVSLPGKERQLEADIEALALTRSSNRRKKSGPKSESATEAPARSSSRKRKQPEESEPVKRSTRSAAKSASGKMKMTATATRRFNKEVNRSLYGSREYASKNPTLSPITERLSFISQSPAAQLAATNSCTAPNQEPHLTLEVGESVTNDPMTEMAYDAQEISDITATNALETPPEASVTSPNSSKESTRVKGRRLSGPRVRGLKRRKVSVSDGDLLGKEPQDQTGEKRGEHCEDKTSTNLEASTETSLKQTVPEQEGVDTEELYVQTSADTPCTDSDGKSECHASLDAPTSACPPLCEESNSLSVPAESAQSKDKQTKGTQRGRRSSMYSSLLPEQGNHAVEQKGDEAASQQENNGSSADSQEEGEVANLDLAPWQADFNFEDVFKPVATRGQRSVRRSLRNKSNAENSTGLVWLPRTSPDSNKEAHRRTRSRRLCTALPVQPLLPEEIQHNAS
ncbi:cell division cycle-associated protein 2 isoform X2 [Thunnus thynnus]|uniref:cell division cycle-associated protein 2 isoform X2 n=1 Tax=Thunnus thynnus TaxID=8237 RepID=UPI003528B0C1